MTSVRAVNKDSNVQALSTNVDDESEVPRTCGQKCLYFFKNVTVEPTVLMFFIGCTVASMSSANLGLEKACRVNLNFTDEICTAMIDQTLESQNQYEKEVQTLVARAMAWKSYFTSTIPCILGVFIGTWQDKTGHRKIFIIYPIVGQIIASLNHIMNVFFLTQLNLEFLAFSEAIIDALSGGNCVLTLTVFAFISAITSEKDRTFRIGMVNLGVMLGLPIGTSLSGIVLKKLGYYGAYGISLTLHTINLLYSIFVLSDPQRTPENKKHDRKGVGHFFRTFFDLSNIKETFKTVFKNGPNRRRLRMCLLLMVVALLYGPTFGEMSVLYMSTRYRFNWDEVKYSLFQAYNFVTMVVGTVFSITVFSKCLQWHDSMLGIISTVSKIMGSFVYCFAPNPTIFFLAPMVEILHGSSMLALRSIFSKLVASNELGKIHSIIGITEYVMPLVYVPMYTQVYIRTMEFFPGAVFLLGATMTVPAVIVFMWLFVEHRRGLKKQHVENGTDVPLKET
ncbi:hypothetical protein ABMA27_015571 [Loxostege sticticalis]|uniref:Adenylate cyclase n=1 Tax=Loxostege sticticalis TaxID=481309 RepID=A0ABR3I855_LOXSC